MKTEASRPGSYGTAGARASLLLLLPIAIWSGNVIVTKMTIGVLAPVSISFYRWLLAFLVLIPILGPAVWQRKRIVARHAWQILTLSALGMVIYQGLSYEAARTTSALNMGIILALMPLVSVFLAFLVAAQRPSPRCLFGGVVSLIGLIYLAAKGRPSALAQESLHVGDALMLAAVTANALYGVLLQRWAIPLGAWHLLFCQIGFAVLMLLPFWLAGPASPIDARGLPLIAYAAIPASLLAPAFWMMGIRRFGTGRSSLSLNLLPLVVAALAWMLLGEDLHAYHVVGGALALFGIAIGMTRPNPPPVAIGRGVRAAGGRVDAPQRT